MQNQPTIRCPCTPVSRAEYAEEDRRTPVGTVIEALAEAADTGPLEVPPLYDSIDGEAVNRLFDGRSPTDEGTVLAFSVADWNVFVRGDGAVVVCDPDGETEPSSPFGSVAGD